MASSNMLAFAFLIARLAVGDSLPESSPPPQLGTVVEEPAIVVHRQPATPLVSLRLALLAADPPGYSGAGHLIQHLVFPTLQERVRRVGGRVQVQRTSDAVVYTVTGPATELTYLSQVLVTALETPGAGDEAILRAGRELREERLAEWETAPAHLRSMLRAQAFPADLPAAGTERSATRFSSATLPLVWGEMYRPDRVSVVAVGDVYLGDVQRAFATLPEAAPPPRRLGIERDSVVPGPLAPAQATRAWLGAAYLAGDLDAAAVTVTARLVQEAIRRRLPTAEVEAEHWWTHHGQALALIVAVPEREFATARQVLGTAVASTLEEINFLRTTSAVTAIRNEMLFYSRTPDRMAELIGQFIDRGGEPHAAELYYSALDSLDDREVREVLERMLSRTPIRAEIPPQTLQYRRP